MDDLLTMFKADFMEAVARRRDDTHLAIARQRDLAAYEQAQLRGFITGTLFQSDDPERYASLNAASRMPTTLDHPNAVVGRQA
ncbi:MAG: hypothetical protein C4297_11125 [Gemmataceae bacterium]